VLESQFDHTLLVSQDDPELELYLEMQRRNIAKLTILPKLGCEGLADQLYKYVNGVYIPDMWGQARHNVLWCYRVEVRETQSTWHLEKAIENGTKIYLRDSLVQYLINFNIPTFNNYIMS
jgi:hypothetical protein